MVVVGIIVLIVSLTLPAIGPMLASNQQAQVANTLSGLLINAQASTSQTATCVGLRIERAFKADNSGRMLDADGNLVVDSGQQPAWLDHQQVRFVTLAARKDTLTAYGTQLFNRIDDTTVQKLPKEYWLAPDYAWPSVPPTWPLSPANSGDYSEDNLTWPLETMPHSHPPAHFNRLDNFYIIFSPEGELVWYPAYSIVYGDDSQEYPNPLPPPPSYLPCQIQHPDESARAVLVYDRRQWNELTADDSAGRALVLQQSRPINISRVTGSIVEEANK